MSETRSGQSRDSRVDLGNLTTVRYSSHGKRFEIIVDPEKAWLYKQGETIALEEIVEGYTVFENLSKGLKADLNSLTEIFGSNDEREIIMAVLDKGDLQITQEQRNRFLKEKREEIIAYLMKHAVNPKTKSPHPASRIEKAMDEAGVRIERKEPTPEQARRILKDIQSIIPIQIESAKIEFVIPAADTGKMYGFVQSSGDVVKENWGKDGTLSMIIQVPAGMVAELLESTSDRSKGRVQATVIERAG